MVVGGWCSMLAGCVLLAGDIIQIGQGLRVSWTILLSLAFLLFVPATLGLMFLSFSGGEKLAILGGAATLIGCMAGASMQVLFRVVAILRAGDGDPAIALLRENKLLVLTTQAPGIFFPVGLLLLALALYRSKTMSRVVALTLAAGAILFPIGHAAGISIGLILGDAALLIAFTLIGRQLVRTE